MIWHKRSFTSHCVKLSPPDFFKCIYLRFWKRAACAGETYRTHQRVIWQVVEGPGFRQRASCAQQMATKSSTNGALLGSFVLVSRRWWPKEPFPEIRLQINKSCFFSHQNQMLTLKKSTFQNSLWRNWFKEGKYFCWKGKLFSEGLTRRILENVYFQGLCPVGL